MSKRRPYIRRPKRHVQGPAFTIGEEMMCWCCPRHPTDLQGNAITTDRPIHKVTTDA